MSDLISRKAAIEAMEQRYCDIERVKKRPVTKGEQAIFLDMRGVVRSLPSVNPSTDSSTTNSNSSTDSSTVEPERKTGKWIDVEKYKGILFECDSCHKYQGTIKYQFCPNCGAKMIEPQESEEV